jgi:hypothetical protein
MLERGGSGAMKRTFIPCVLFLLAACGGGGGGKCASPYTGTWIGTTVTDQLNLSDSCDYQYQGPDGCRSTGTYAAPLGSQGSVQVVIQSTTGGRCIPPGTYACSYSASSSTLTFNCGFGTFSYRR